MKLKDLTAGELRERCRARRAETDCKGCALWLCRSARSWKGRGELNWRCVLNRPDCWNLESERIAAYEAEHPEEERFFNRKLEELPDFCRSTLCSVCPLYTGRHCVCGGPTIWSGYLERDGMP